MHAQVSGEGPLLAAVTATLEGACSQQVDGPDKARLLQQAALQPPVRLCGARADQG